MATPTGIKLLSALRVGGSTSAIRSTPETFFTEQDELAAFLWLRNFVETHRAFPNPLTFRQHTGITTVRCTEPFAYYYDEARKRALYGSQLESFAEMREAIEALDPDRVVQLAQAMVQAGHGLQVSISDYITLDSAIGLVLEDFRIAQLSSTMRGIPTGWQYCDEVTGGWQNDDLISVVGRPGTGKAQPLTANIRTPRGWVKMGDLKIGDELISVDGKPSKVTAIYPQGKKDVYRFTFTDGRTAEACNEHLWEIMYREWVAPRIVTTQELRYMLQFKRYQKRLSVRMISGEFGECTELPVDPWLLGALIGDGGFTQSVMFSTADQFLIDKVNARLPTGCYLVYRSQYDYSVVSTMKTNGKNPLKDALTTLGLMGCKSSHKRIPRMYMNASKQQRLELLRGLLDTDGYVGKSGTVDIAVSNKLLAEDIQELVRSIGGWAKIKAKETTHLVSYKVSIRYANPCDLVTLPRKLSRLSKGYQYSNLRNVIDSVEFIGHEECQCIAVSHPSHLYVTDNYVVTHNTYILLMMAYAAWLAGYSVLFISNELGAMQLARRLVGIHTRINPTLIRTGRISTIVANRIDEMVSGLRNGIPFNVVQGGLKKSVETVQAVAEATNPDLILADASYLLTPAKKRKGAEGRREMVSDTVEDLKRITIELHKPIVQSVQFNRTAERSTGRKDSNSGDSQIANPTSHLSLAKIGETDVIGQASSVVLGTALPPFGQPQDTRWLAFLKGREGEQGFWQIHYKFDPVDLSQIRVGVETVEAEIGTNEHIQGMI